jgi:dTDP-4-dehydrorhamnose 3,5-epimerase-like enzyme
MKLNPSFKDDRGEIIDIFVKSPKDHCSIITSKKGAVRGNHFHKKSTQYTFIVSGKFILSRAKVDDDGNLKEKVSSKIKDTNELIEHPPTESHTLVAETDDATILAFACGTRGGNFYEKDTFRLKKKLNI